MCMVSIFAAHYVWYAKSSKKLHRWNSMMHESTQIWSVQIAIDNHYFSHQCSNNELKHVHEWHENKKCMHSSENDKICDMKNVAMVEKILR
jgi:hypothetical protein